jgi:hypothetical protein
MIEFPLVWVENMDKDVTAPPAFYANKDGPDAQAFRAVLAS